MGEFELIRRFFDRGPARRAELGIGDDCALLRSGGADRTLVVTTDMLVGGRHFREDTDPEGLGHKALAVNLSDLASMGASPLAFTLALALPAADERWLGAFRSGLFAIADRFDCELIGGDTTRGPLNLCITAIGELPVGTALRRDRAEPGDDLWVSGELGGAAMGLARLREPDAPASGSPLLARLERPEPRVALGVALRHLARAAIDLSDGLLGDLGHICERSRVGAEVDWTTVPLAPGLESVPAQQGLALALAGGDDYELLFTALPENRGPIEALGRSLGLPLARIGRIVAGGGVRVLDARAAALRVDARSYDHFG
jgi:thiamine-monophosphate kinase